MIDRGRRISRLLSVALLMLCASAAALAHEFTLDAVMNAFVKVEQNEAHLLLRAPLYVFKSVRFPVKGIEIDVDNSSEAVQRALAALQQDVVLLEDGRALQARRATGRLSLPSDRSFQSYEMAAQHVSAPNEPGIAIVIDQGYVDAHLVYAIGSPDAVFSLRSTVAPELGMKLAVRLVGQSSESRSMLIRSGHGAVDLNPTFLGAASSFMALGVRHIITGFDHLLFVLCLVIPPMLRRMVPLLTIVTAFTLAHSFTLIGSAFGLAPQGAWFEPFVEMLVALSIVYAAVENIVGVDARRRVLLTVMFGMVHGFAFAESLRQDLQFAGSHLLTALFAFNLGIEVGQLIALAIMLAALAVVTRHVLTGRVGLIVLSALIAHVGLTWTTERWDALSKVPWPTLEVSGVATLLLWAGALVLLATFVRSAVRHLRLDTLPASAGSARLSSQK